MSKVLQQKLTSEQWARIDSKYGGLYVDISNKIYNSDLDKKEIVQELKLKTIKILYSFCEKYSIDFDKAIDDEIFNKYLKTGLWNWRNTLCKNIITKAKNTENKPTVSLETLGVTNGSQNSYKDIKDTRGHITFAEIDFNDDKYSLSAIQLKIVDLILTEGNCYLHNNSINYSYICNKLNINYKFLLRQLELLKEKIGNK